MKAIEIRRNTESHRLRFRVCDNRTTIREEFSSHTDIRKLRRQLWHVFGRNVRLAGLGG